LLREGTWEVDQGGRCARMAPLATGGNDLVPSRTAAPPLGFKLSKEMQREAEFPQLQARLRSWGRLPFTVGLAALLWSGAAAANGRFPRAQRLIEDESDATRLAIYGTYGLVTTSDAGKTWQYVCEAATGPFAGEAPLLELLPEGRVVLSSETGLRGSTFPACDWRGLLEPELPNSVQDITRDPASSRGLWALLNQPDVDVGYRAALSRSSDAGETWSENVSVPDGALAQGLTIDVAASRPERVYLSGLDAERNGVLARSDDAGATWQGFPIPGTSSVEMPYLAQIDARDPNRVFVRTDALKDYDQQLQPDDALLYSADGGESFVRVLSRRAKLLGFALSPDGETVLLGYGDPVLYAYTVEPEQTGLYRLRTAELLADPEHAGTKVEKIFSGSVTCLRWTEHAVYACLAQAEQGFEAGRARDAEFSLTNPKPFAPLLDLKALTPLACGASTSAAVCTSDPNAGWPAVCGKLGADCTVTHGDSAAEDARTGESSGCGCRIAALPGSAPPHALALLALLALLQRRSRSAHGERGPRTTARPHLPQERARRKRRQAAVRAAKRRSVAPDGGSPILSVATRHECLRRRRRDLVSSSPR
jgi:hypothetical protein